MAAVLALQASLRKPLPLRQYVNEALAIYIRPHDYSFAKLTRAVAEQIGGAHEDDEIEEALAAMHSLIIGGDQSHVVVLVHFADTVLRAGREFLSFMATKHGYRAHRFQLA